MKSTTQAPALDPLLAALTAAQARRQFFPSAPPTTTVVVVAVSGGADSVCLLHALHTLAPEWGLELHVAHIDHGLRPEAASDAAFVAHLAADLGLVFHTTRLDPERLRQRPCGLEAAARDARYAWLGATARLVTPAGQPPLVAVGHQADDQAETLLLHLVQGTGVEGLAGMRWVDVLPDAGGSQARAVQLVRPLLGVRRAAVEAYLRRHELAWCTDATNAQHDYLRNRIRHQVLPLLTALNPQITTALGRSATLLADAATRLDALDANQLTTLVTEPVTPERVVLDWAAWVRLPDAERRATLHAALQKLAVDHRQLGFAQVDALAFTASAAAHASGPHPLAGGAAWTLVGAHAGQPLRLCLHLAAALPTAPTLPYLDATWRTVQGSLPLPLPGAWPIGAWQLTAQECPRELLPAGWQQNPDPWSAYLAADCVGEPALTTTTRGQKIVPLGLHGHSQAIGDLFTARKIPVSHRSGWPLIVDRRSQRVLWACGLCISHWARITPATTHVVSLTWERVAQVSPQ